VTLDVATRAQYPYVEIRFGRDSFQVQISHLDSPSAS
jgi:hypothetical protein